MNKTIKIGKYSFKYKKDALAHFKKILNSYNFDEILNSSDMEDVIALASENGKRNDRLEKAIKEIKVSKVQYGTKCFEIIYSDLSSRLISYTKCINGEKKPLTKFSIACRNAVQEDLRNVKQQYFDMYSEKGRVKCQETGKLSFWIELNVDHRQPNTFSVIVDRFIELHSIDLLTIEYIENIDNIFLFKDQNLTENFRKYHKEKANLRLVRKEKNLGRSHQARVKRQKKDLKIES